MGRCLTKEIYEMYYGEKTSFGNDLNSCIQTGIDNFEKMLSCGIVAADEECYDVFSHLFDEIIKIRHKDYENNATRYLKNVEEPLFTPGQIDFSYVRSFHFLLGRCLEGYRFPPTCTRAERFAVEKIIKSALKGLQGQFEGDYFQLVDLNTDDIASLPEILQTVAERPLSNTLRACGSARDWPHGRGVFYTEDEKLHAWVNREDHLRVMYRVCGENENHRSESHLSLVESFSVFCKAMSQLELILLRNGVNFAYHEKYGYLLSSPSGIGTALRVGARLKLPHLKKDSNVIGILKTLRLQLGMEDESQFQQGFLDICNVDRIGIDEKTIVDHMSRCISILVSMEKRLEQGKDIDDLITSCQVLYKEPVLYKEVSYGTTADN